VTKNEGGSRNYLCWVLGGPISKIDEKGLVLIKIDHFFSVWWGFLLPLPRSASAQNTQKAKEEKQDTQTGTLTGENNDNDARIGGNEKGKTIKNM